MSRKTFRIILLVLLAVAASGYVAQKTFAQTSQSVLYVPLIGITSVPDPLVLPVGGGSVTYHYAVKDFLREVTLSDIKVVDDTCSPVTFVTGDDNGDGELEYNETWRYVCTTKLSTTTESSATVTGVVGGITATHTAYASVVVGSTSTPPIVSIVNITKIAYPLSLPVGGGSITYTYKVNNPGTVPLSDVTVTDDKCSAMSGELGDINGNGLLDPDEVWIYTCTTNLKQTTTNTATVTAYANGLRAVDHFTLTVDVAIASSGPGLPDTGSAATNSDPNILVWEILGGILAVLVIIFFIRRTHKQ